MKKSKFICSNEKFETNIEKGFKGSVTKNPIYKDKSAVLRLEYVREIKKPKNEIFWFMWYKSDGTPLLIESAVFDKDALLEVIKNIKEIKF
jgi:hypothetical protein